MSNATEQPEARHIQDVLESLGVHQDRGLDPREVDARRGRHGPNRLREAERRSVRAILFEQFKSMIVAILAVAAVLAFTFGEFAEGIAIVAVILVNTAISFVSEWRAQRSMEALRKLEEDTIRVRREGDEREISSEELVPGDIALFEQGDLVPADLRLIEANSVRVNEASLTGESVPVDKQLEPVEPDAPLAERTNMLFCGTTVVEGSGEAVVVATGMETELGRIAEMAETAEKEITPLQQRLNKLGTRLAWITLATAAVVAVVGLLAGQEPVLMIQTAIALGVAAIPEGLPIVATIALARGMWYMARRHALINQLPAVETLGATRIIFTDKTGTLTQNRMTLQKVVTSSGEIDLRDESSDRPSQPDPLLRRVLEIGVLCNNAKLVADDADGEPGADLGDPTEIALLRGGAALGVDRGELLAQRPEAREVPFHTDTKMMATYHEIGGHCEVAVKGAPQAVMEKCGRIASADGQGEQPFGDEERQRWLDRSEELASEGLRLLAIADKQVENAEEEPYENLRLVGLVGLADPPAEDVAAAIQRCQRAGIRVVMVTGDQPATARAIGRQVGMRGEDGGEELDALAGQDVREPDQLSEDERRRLLRTSIFARVSPEQKFRLIRLHQDAGEIVAMTGDGVNDAPALKKADIGVAMGRRGTDAAKQAADMILQDDRFSSIVAAVEQGRIIFGNIRKSVMFMLCTNVAEVIAVALASLAKIPLPLHPLQILYLNVLTDVFPALALSVGKGPPEVMDQPPRRSGEPVLARRHWTSIGVWALVLAGCVLAALLTAWLWLGMEEAHAVTVSFLTLGFAKLWFVFNLRQRGSRLWENDIVRNPWVWSAIAFCAGLLAAAVYVPGLSGVLHTHDPGWQGWSVVLGLSLLPLLAGQVVRACQHSRAEHQPPSKIAKSKTISEQG